MRTMIIEQGRSDEGEGRMEFMIGYWIFNLRHEEENNEYRAGIRNVEGGKAIGFQTLIHRVQGVP